MSLKQRTGPPTFHPGRLHVVDRGRRCYVGRGLFGEHARVFFMQTRTGRRTSRVAPVAAFLRRHPRRFPPYRGRFPLGKLARYEVKKVLYYDTGNQEAGLLVRDNRLERPANLYHLHWDLARRRITRADVLGTRSLTTRWVSVKPIGYNPTSKEAYLQVVERVRGPGADPPIARPLPRPSRLNPWASLRSRQRENWGKPAQRVRVLAVGRRGVRTIATFRIRRSLHGPPRYDAARSRALLVEYAERKGERPLGYLVDLRTGRVRSLPIPLVTYGTAFTPDGKALLLYGAQPGLLQRFDLGRWRVARSRRMRGYGHAIGLPFADTLLVVRHRTLHVIDPLTLRERQRIPTARFYRGSSQIQGSVVGPGGLWLRNTRRSATVYRIRFTR